MSKAIIEQRAGICPERITIGAIQNGHDQTSTTAIHFTDKTAPSLQGETGFTAPGALVRG